MVIRGGNSLQIGDKMVVSLSDGLELEQLWEYAIGQEAAANLPFGGIKRSETEQTPIYSHVLPDFAKHLHLFCHLPWQSPAWKNCLAALQPFANHTI